MTHDPAGYDYGSDRVPRSPVTLDDLRRLEETVGLTAEDRRFLAMAGEVLSDQVEKMVDAWRARIGAQEGLARLSGGNRQAAHAREEERH
jgi:Protoglobin